jgi:hypothetical protein
MAKIKVDDGTVKAHDIQLDRIEIVTDTATPGKIEIYMLDSHGHRVEGGSFDSNAFLNLVKLFYDENF